MSEAKSLLKTKYIKPALRTDTLYRSRLLDQCEKNSTNIKNNSFLNRLILISAPAGYGKTTLISSWLENRGPTAWLSLDEADNDPNRFWLYFASALNKNYNIGRSMLSILESGSIPVDSGKDNDLPYEEALVLLLNELADMNEPASLVLDDYHHIDDGQINRGLQFLVENLPPNFQLIIISRTDPPLPLARWRSKGWMSEVRQKDLRFNLEETAQLIKKVSGFELSSKQTQVLDENTEGWASSLHVIASIISARQDLDKEIFIKNLNQSRRYIFDYLSDETLDQQDPDVVSFLLDTSILEYLTPEAYRILSGREDAEVILRKLEAENLFIISLDQTGQWYRYHNLFAEMLRLRLVSNKGKANLTSLHKKAAAWKARLRLIEGRHDPVLLDDTIEMLLKRNLFPNQDLEGPVDFFRLDEYLALARVLIARNHASETEKFLPRIQQIAEKEKILYLLAEVLLLRAIAAVSNDKAEKGYMYFREALQKCGPRIQQEGIKRLFLNEGKAVEKLLHLAQNEGLYPELTASLLSAIEKTTKPIVHGTSEPALEDQRLIEELSDRELEVLELINAGLTNQDISSRLYLSLNTVKWHLKNIYGKLAVDNRAAAAARARSPGLI